MANVLSKPVTNIHKGFSGHDMSQLLKFSSTTGELLPVYYDILYPGDKVKMSSLLKTRTMPLDTAAMTNIVEHIDWFAVPLDQIYSLFSQMMYDINDNKSSLFDADDYDDAYCCPLIPAASFNTFLQTVRGVSHTDKYFSISPWKPTNRPYAGTELRLLELLGIPLKAYDGTTDTQWTVAVNPMLACAYQKIYFDYFRLADRELNDPEAYNLDKHYVSLQVTTQSVIQKMFTLRYRPYMKDFYTHLYVSPLFGIRSGQAFNPTGSTTLKDSFNQWLLSSVQYASGSTFPLDNDPLAINGAVDARTPTALGGRYVAAERTSAASALASTLARTVSAATSPTSIRTSFALQKLLEITRRAGKHVDDQTLAHFGVKTSSRLSGECYHIGHSKSSIVIGDVISTAAAGGEPLGTIAGKGYNHDNSGNFEFENKEACPCILMAIYSAEPAMDYLPVGLEKFNVYHKRGDFFQPVFDNLGMQPLFLYQTEFQVNANAVANNAFVLGWQYRWMESKVKSNKICGALARTLSSWTTHKTRMIPDLNSQGNPQSLPLTAFLVSPFALDTIMTPYQFDGSDNPDPLYSGDQLFDFDPLIHELYFDVNKASEMSTFGLESL